MSDEFYQRAVGFAARYCETQPDIVLSEEAPFTQGNSHRVVRAYSRSVGPVVFKFFANPASREREIAALRHFAGKAPVPSLLDDSAERLLVLSEVAGTTLRHQPAPAPSVFRDLGRTLAAITRVPLRDQDTVRIQILAHRDRHYLAARLILARAPLYNTVFFRRSLRLAESVPLPSGNDMLCLCLQDVNPSNLLVKNRRLNGIVDLEGALPGTPVTQAGMVLFACAVYSDELGISASRLWRMFQKGWQEVKPSTFLSADRPTLLAGAYQRAWSIIHAEGAGGETPAPSWFRLPRAHRMRRWMTICHVLAFGDR